MKRVNMNNLITNYNLVLNESQDNREKFEEQINQLLEEGNPNLSKVFDSARKDAVFVASKLAEKYIEEKQINLEKQRLPNGDRVRIRKYGTNTSIEIKRYRQRRWEKLNLFEEYRNHTSIFYWLPDEFRDFFEEIKQLKANTTTYIEERYTKASDNSYDRNRRHAKPDVFKVIPVNKTIYKINDGYGCRRTIAPITINEIRCEYGTSSNNYNSDSWSYRIDLLTTDNSRLDIAANLFFHDKQGKSILKKAYSACRVNQNKLNKYALQAKKTISKLFDKYDYKKYLFIRGI